MAGGLFPRRLNFLLQHPERLWITCAVMVLGFGVLLAGYLRSPLRGWRKWAAFLCKLAALSLLALCVSDPLWTRQQPKKGENELAIVADNSASLTVAETRGGKTRAQSVKEALGGGADGESAWMGALSGIFRVKTLLADERLRGVADFGALDFSGRRSDLTRALKMLHEGAAGRSLAAVVLVTDGHATDATSPGWTQGEGARPVFPVIVGDQAPAPDLAIQDVIVTQTAFEDAPVMMTVKWDARGFDGREAAVCALDEEGRVLVSEKLKVLAKPPQAVARLKVPVVKPGVSFLRIAVMESALLAKAARDEWRALAKEAVLSNNERLVCVDRGQGPYRVLYVSGRPNWEYKFIRRALAGDDEVQVPSLIRIAKREPKFEWRGRVGESSNPLFRGFGDQSTAQRYDQPVLIRLGTRDAQELSEGFPKSAGDLFGEYRAIILDDLEADFFTQEQMKLIERHVSERGGALLMLGGQESYQAGGYEHTPVGRMLPVYLDRVTSAPPVQNARFNLTREGWLEPWTRLRPSQEEDEGRLAGMPGFHSVNQTFSIKPGASVLATVSTQDATYPALAAQRFGEGRVVALTLGDVWRWGMGDADAMKDQERFWRQLMRWLVVDVPDRVQVAAEPLEQSVRLAVRARAADFLPMDDALVKLEVTGPEGGKSLLYGEPSLAEPGLFEAEYFPKTAGAYRVTATVENAAPPDESVEHTPFASSKSTGWVFQPQVEEMSRLEPARATLQRLADETGGRLLTLNDLDKLPELLSAIEVPVRETLSEPLWHTPWFFALILALLGAEWLLRRKGGMA
ncbi:MAG TPA: hypothetical protein DIT13_16125 [Verrucomicrobiales bacterium]|nr:hypothetical protein [Verrucomicrobiales bacterium]